MNNQQAKPDWLQQAQSMRFETRAFIGGDYTAPKKITLRNKDADQSIFKTVNPATENELAVFTDADASIIDQAAVAARAAFASWKILSPDQRKIFLFAVADEIESNKNTSVIRFFGNGNAHLHGA